VPGVDRPIYIASTPGADAQMDIGAEFEERDITVRDARQLQPPSTLDVQGFALLSHPVRVLDFYQLEDQREHYEQSIRDLVLREIGGSQALVFDHTLRSDSRQVRGERAIREPAAVIHTDYTDASAQRRLRDLLPATEVEQRLQRRFAIVNVWRSIAGPARTSPLALCDAQTLRGPELVASERLAEQRTGELELVTFSEAHRWYFFPDVTRDEALLIKTYDSALDGRARRSIHTAFANPQATKDAPPRESIESRLMVFF
jgi:hypothetical protein